MISVNVTSNIRGFLRNLFNYRFDNIEFVYEQESLYEIPGTLRKMGLRLLRLKIFDFLGIFRTIDQLNVEENISFSYNKFLNTNKPYIIFLENPAALVSYCWNRPKFYKGQERIKNYFQDNNLKAIVCMSKICEETFEIMYPFKRSFKLMQLYPLILDDYSYTEKDVKRKTSEETLRCLYISANFLLKGGRDIISVFRSLREKNIKMHLTIITKIDSIPKTDKKILNEMDNIEIINFSLSYDELKEIYKKSSILIYPTRMDSFSLVTLEAIKYGNAVIVTDVYALKEMVSNGQNGYINKAMYSWWGDDGFPNPDNGFFCRRYLHSGILDHELIKVITEQLTELDRNRNKLYGFCHQSLTMARETDFSEEYITKEWKKLIESSI